MELYPSALNFYPSEVQLLKRAGRVADNTTFWYQTLINHHRTTKVTWGEEGQRGPFSRRTWVF